MADMNNKSVRYPNLTPEELQVIGYFAKGQRHPIASSTLRLECTDTSIRLVDSQGKLIGIGKQTNEWQQKVLINSNSVYTSSIVEILTDFGFVTKQKSSHPDFTEHHYYQVPVDYKLNHTDILQLWKVWWNNKRYQLNSRNVPIDVLIFSKGNWCPVQDLQPKQGNFILKTDRGELTISAKDFVVWIDKADSQTITSAPSSPLATNQIESVPTPPISTPVNLPDRATMPTEVLPTQSAPTFQAIEPIVASQIEQIELPEAEEDLDLETYLNTFSTEETEDIDRIEGIYNIQELLNGTVDEEVAPPPPARSKPTFRLEVTVVEPPAAPPANNAQPQLDRPIAPPATIHPPQPTPAVAPPTSPKLPATARSEQPPATPATASAPVSIAERKRSLKIKAVNTLTNYLQHGDTVTNTEVLKNGQGRVMNQKTTTVQQGCPGWTVEQIKQLQEELAEI